MATGNSNDVIVNTADTMESVAVKTHPLYHIVVDYNYSRFKESKIPFFTKRHIKNKKFIKHVHALIEKNVHALNEKSARNEIKDEIDKIEKLLIEVIEDKTSSYKKTIPELFITLTKTMFKNNINWGRIYTLLEYSAQFSELCFKLNKQEYIEKIHLYTSILLISETEEWIRQNDHFEILNIYSS